MVWGGDGIMLWWEEREGKEKEEAEGEKQRTDGRFDGSPDVNPRIVFAFVAQTQRDSDDGDNHGEQDQGEEHHQPNLAASANLDVPEDFDRDGHDYVDPSARSFLWAVRRFEAELTESVGNDIAGRLQTERAIDELAVRFGGTKSLESISPELEGAGVDVYAPIASSREPMLHL